MNTAARRFMSLLNWSCFDFEAKFCIGSFTPSPNPMIFQSRTRSMSSENRSISPCAFESDVPPLKTRDFPNRDFRNRSFNTTQTQKSFSIIVDLIASCAAASEKMSRRSCAGSRASLSIRSFFSDVLDRRVNPARCRFGIDEYPLPQGAVKLLADLRDDLTRDAVLTVCFQGLHEEPALRKLEPRLL